MHVSPCIRIAACCALLGCSPPFIAAAAQPQPNIRPLTDRVFEASAARVARGRYLAEGLLMCLACHSERDWAQPGAPPKAGMKGAGQIFNDEPGKRVVAPNITPDRDTGAGTWSDDMFARAIREGVGHDGRPLHPQMWYRSFRILADEDLASVVVYLRTLPAVRHPLPKTELSAERAARITSELKPLTEPVSAPGTTPFERGSYFVRLADCQGCHTSWYSKRMPGLYAGGNPIEFQQHKAFSTNITPDASGVKLGREGFIELIRGGKNGTLSPLMPWIVFKNLSDDDLDAMRIALAKLPPVSHYISNAVPPTHCPVCLQEHGLGDRNHVDEVAVKVTLDAHQRAALVGSYRAREDGHPARVEADGEVLYLSGGDERLRMYAQTPTRFLVPGNVLPVYFELDAKGMAARMVEDDLEPFIYDRVTELQPAKAKQAAKH